MKTVGFATLDVVAAHEIYRRARTEGAGREVSL
jgi:ornithine cyclodeaminase/alanine dehydrogenase-like protein (mu-crystallin family)